MFCRILDSDQIWVEQVILADNFWTRLKGLLGRSALAENEGLLIRPCNSVHTLGMTFAIGVIFLDRDNRILQVIPLMKPGRLSPLVRGAKQVLELHPSRLEQGRVQVGMQVEFGEARKIQAVSGGDC